MDDRTFQVVLAIATGGLGYLLFKSFIGSTRGGPGGLAGAANDFILGEVPNDAEQGVYQAPTPGNSVPDPAVYVGNPVLAFFVNPAPGGIVRRLMGRSVYAITIEAKNMTPQRVDGAFTIEVNEGGETINTVTDVKTLEPGERKQFTIMVNTNQLFVPKDATAKVRFGSLYLTFCNYWIKPE